jgi:hypothetical protein
MTQAGVFTLPGVTGLSFFAGGLARRVASFIPEEEEEAAL